MDAARKFQVGMAVAHMPIGHDGIAHYQQAHGLMLERWERQAILAMDKPRLIHLNQSEGEQGARSSSKPAVSDQPVTPQLLQALFGKG